MGTPHIPHDVQKRLEKWLRDNAEDVSRGMSISEASVRATKALGCRIQRTHMEDAAIAIGFTGFRSHVQPPPAPAPSAPSPAPAADDDDNEEVISLAAEYTLLKRQILLKSAKVEDAKRFAEEANQVYTQENAELQTLVREQIRIRNVIKEAMEV